MKADPF